MKKLNSLQEIVENLKVKIQRNKQKIAQSTPSEKSDRSESFLCVCDHQDNTKKVLVNLERECT